MSNENDSLNIFYEEMAKHSPLSQEEQKEITKKIRELKENGSNPQKLESYINKMIKHNQRLVLWVANYLKKKYEYSKPVDEDMLQLGTIGLWNAAKKYDHTKGASFGTYAVWQIGAPIRKYIENEMKNSSYSLDSGINEDEDENTKPKKDLMENDNSTDPTANLDKIEGRNEVKKMISKLPEKQRAVMELLYGATQEGEFKIKEAAKRLKITPEQVRRLESKALRKLEKMSIET